MTSASWHWIAPVLILVGTSGSSLACAGHAAAAIPSTEAKTETEVEIPQPITPLWSCIRLEDHRDTSLCDEAHMIEIRSDKNYVTQTCMQTSTRIQEQTLELTKVQATHEIDSKTQTETRVEARIEVKSGRLSAEAFDQITRLANDVIQAGLQESEVCLELAYMGLRTLELTLDTGSAVQVHNMSVRGSCFLADMAHVNALGAALFALLKEASDSEASETSEASGASAEDIPTAFELRRH